jgi:hypothetical protein
VGDTSSCAHLREALADKWGLDVPGDWMNWNGGVFLFADGAQAFLDEWHERALAAFEDPRFQTRDQHALIATVWSRGLQDQPCLPPEFNTIVDLGSYDITWRGGTRYAVHPDEAPREARFLHLYSNDLHDPRFDLRADVEDVVLQRMARRSADQVGGLVVKTGQAIVDGAEWVVDGIRRAAWAVIRTVVIPVIDVLRRAGRSLARRRRVLLGREPSPGGRRDALRFPKAERRRRAGR